MPKRKEADEKAPLLGEPWGDPSLSGTPPTPGSRLSTLAAACCVVDLFGVFPVLALPRALLACGWWGLALALVVVALQVHTGRLLGRCWLLAREARPRWAHEHRRDPYTALAQLAYGPRARTTVATLLHIAVFGSYVPDLLFAAENMHLVGRRLWAMEDDGLSFCVWLVVLGIVLAPILCLGSPKDQKYVTTTSVALVVTTAALTWVCVAARPFSPTPPPPLPGPSLPPLTLQAAALAYGNLVFQFDAHPSLLTVQVDMAEPQRLGHAITGAFALSTALALVTTVLSGLLRPGTAGRADVLQALPGSPPLYAAVLLATAQIGLSTVVSGSALFQDLEKRFGVPSHFTWKRCAVRVTLLAVAVLLALASPRLPLAMGLLGAAVTGPLSLVLPPLLHQRLLHRFKGPLPLPPTPEPSSVFYTGSTEEQGPSKSADSKAETEPEGKDEAKLLLEPRRSSEDAAATAAEQAAAAEKAASKALLSDLPYRRMADDTQLPPEAPEGSGPWRRLLAFLDRRLYLDDAKESSTLHSALCIALAVVGTASSVIAVAYVARDALLGIGAGRGPPSCLGLPF